MKNKPSWYGILEWKQKKQVIELMVENSKRVEKIGHPSLDLATSSSSFDFEPFYTQFLLMNKNFVEASLSGWLLTLLGFL